LYHAHRGDSDWSWTLPLAETINKCDRDFLPRRDVIDAGTPQRVIHENDILLMEHNVVIIDGEFCVAKPGARHRYEVAVMKRGLPDDFFRNGLFLLVRQRELFVRMD